MNIKIVAIGKLKEDYLKQAVAEYSKRLSRFVKLSMVELSEEKLGDKASAKEEEICKSKEAQQILSKIKDNEFVIALAPKGKELSSEDLAKLLETQSIGGISNITFVIGGSLGLGEELLQRANQILSFSKMTFPHQLFRVLLLEQIYRGYKIIGNEVYHK